MKRKHGTVSLKIWNLDATDKMLELLGSAVRDAAAEALQLALDDEETYAFFPAIWGDSDGCGGPRCDDPLTVYFRIAATDGDEGPIWATSLTEMIEEEISRCAEDAEDGIFNENLVRIRDALRDLADRIDNAMPSNAALTGATPNGGASG